METESQMVQPCSMTHLTAPPFNHTTECGFIFKFTTFLPFIIKTLTMFMQNVMLIYMQMPQHCVTKTPANQLLNKLLTDSYIQMYIKMM